MLAVYLSADTGGPLRRTIWLRAIARPPAVAESKPN